jgi:hypothetical protein
MAEPAVIKVAIAAVASKPVFTKFFIVFLLLGVSSLGGQCDNEEGLDLFPYFRKGFVIFSIALKSVHFL